MPEAAEVAFPDGNVEEVAAKDYDYYVYGYPYYLCKCSFEEYEEYWGVASVDVDTEATAWCPCFQYDYCSMGLQVEVYNDAQDYIIDIFNGYDIPMDPYTCPFHPSNLEYIREAKNLALWKRAKKVGQRDKAECPICRKTFKTGEYYEFHVKTSHPFSLSANNFDYKLGSQDRGLPAVPGGSQKQ